MKKFKILVALSLVFIFQEINATIDTTSTQTIVWSQMNNSYITSGADLYFDSSKDMGKTGLIPYFYLEIPLNDGQEISNIELIEIVEEGVMVQADLLEILKLELEESYNVTHITKKRNNKNFVALHFPAVISSQLKGVVNRLRSFKIIYEISENRSTFNKSKSLVSFPVESAMKIGKWYQFELQNPGIYKISFEDLSNAGIDIAGFSSNDFKMYGFGGMLSEKNSELEYGDIPEIAIQMFDGGDNSFDAGDYFLFYGQGPDTWKFNQSSNSFSHQINIYERKSFYYFVLSQGNGKRIATLNSNADFDASFSSFIDYAFIEDEEVNLITSGRRWFGDVFEFTTNYTYNFNFDNIKPNSDIHINTVLAARSEVTSRFTVKALGETDLVNISSVSDGLYAGYANDGSSELNLKAGSNQENIAVEIDYNQPLSGSIGWLDYIEVQVERDLIFSNGQMSFRNPESIQANRISQFIIQNNSGVDPNIWDVTQVDHPAKINYSSAASQLRFNVPTNSLKEFIIFDNTNLLRPVFVKETPNQNLHGEINHEYIIISHPDFLSQANELADFHREHSGLDVFVTELEPIYHEYSSGRQDISAIRNFIRSVYINSSEDNKLKYVLFFGDASVDYFNRLDNNTNMVPTWQSFESFNPISSIATDDFFGYLDEDEGGNSSDEIDIGIGRFPVVNTAQAQDMVDKAIHYSTNSHATMKDWRNTICFIADDEDRNLHVQQANDLSILVDSIHPIANLDKIFVDAYKQETSPAGQRYPEVNEAINQRLDKGALIISYTGHGGELGWGQERFLGIPDINSWTNYDRLPVFLTATCEFARYDDPKRVSAGELILLNNKGGSISLFTTSRATYASSNFTVSSNFYKIALTKENGSYLSMGEILKRTKLASGSGVNVTKFVLLGDPALKIAIPQKNVVVTSVINNGSEARVDTINALSNITIAGEIRDETNQLLSDFNGTIYPTIYDKSQTKYTLGQDKNSFPYPFELRNNKLYRSTANVRKGKFEFTFVVPKDIAYTFGNGKISMYAENGEIDAAGYNNEIIIGGFDELASEDYHGPKIELYINNSNFVDGGTTDENPVLLAYVSDDYGINTTGNGIGHDISATLDGNPNEIKILNDYYIADANSYKSGVISFPYFNLENGPHTIELKLWDIHNNSNKASINFVVASSGTMALNALFNYPNPVSDYTTFSFEHNQSGEDLDVIIEIYSIDGKRVTSIEKRFTANSYRNNEIEWDATDESGAKISKGVYIYKVNLQNQSGAKASQTSRLVVIK
jgi:hypothetical protein